MLHLPYNLTKMSMARVMLYIHLPHFSQMPKCPTAMPHHPLFFTSSPLRPLPPSFSLSPPSSSPPQPTAQPPPAHQTPRASYAAARPSARAYARHAPSAAATTAPSYSGPAHSRSHS